MSAPTAVSLHLMISYRDGAAAIAWLERALGFTTTMRSDGDDGTVVHAELRRDEVAVIVFDDAGAGYDHPGPHGDTVGISAYIVVSGPEAVDAVWASATEAGATEVWSPHWSEWGNYRCRVRDPEGREWTFGVHRPGEAA